MIRAIENGIFESDLNANNFVLKNVDVIHSTNLVEVTDPRLSYPRMMLPGSVTDDSVADDAMIDQSKLALNGPISPSFLGFTSGTAAEGDLAEMVAHKNQANGYAGLGSDGRMLTGSTPTSGTGRLHSIDIEFPFEEFITLPTVSTTTRTFTAVWFTQPDGTFLGNTSGGPAPPSFSSPFRQLPLSVIPNVDGSKFTSGTFDPSFVPIVKGVGGSHAVGILPSPGATGLTQDYFARDGTFKPMVAPSVSYQPKYPAPSITLISYYRGQAYIQIKATSSSPTTGTAGVVLFYNLNGGSFSEPVLPLLVSVGTLIGAYAAKIGYTNSDLVTFTVPPSSTF